MEWTWFYWVFLFSFHQMLELDALVEYELIKRSCQGEYAINPESILWCFVCWQSDIWDPRRPTNHTHLLYTSRPLIASETQFWQIWKVHPPVTYAWLLEYLSFVLKMYKQFLDPVSICAKKTIPARICIQVETAKYLHSQQSSSFVYWYIFFLSWSLSSWDDSTFRVLGTQFLPTLLGLATLCLSSRLI